MATREIERNGKSYTVEKNGSYSVSRAGMSLTFSLPSGNTYRVGGFSIGATGNETFESILSEAIRDLEDLLQEEAQKRAAQEGFQKRREAVQQQADDFFAEDDGS